MLKIVSSVAIAALSATTAFAADLPLKAPAAAPVKFTWTGCYIGGHVGGAVSEDRLTNTIGQSRNYGAPGFTGGGQVGCDYQFAPNWVIGGEARAAWSSLTYSVPRTAGIAPGVTSPSHLSVSNDFLASATARLGYSFVERWLVYARGGAAWTREKADDAFVNFAGIAVDPSATVTRTGWTAGTGVEWAFAPHWSANIEYNYYDFGDRSIIVSSPTNRVLLYSLKDKIHAATIGVNYHF
jgi:outer membrane immunogenic protein